MDEPELEDLFLRFREQGDANALAAVFDRTASELLTLALHLAPEASAAEDLVQATFFAAIQGGLASAHLSIPATSTPVTTRFDLELAPKVEEPATLVLVADNVADLAEEKLLVDLEPLELGRRWEHKGTFKRTDGRYELTGLAPARWRVIVRPCAHHWGSLAGGSFTRDIVFEVSIKSGERLERTIHFARGGRVRFEVEGWDGASKDDDWARAVLCDERGERVALNCEQRFLRQGSLASNSRADSIALVGSCDQLSSMAPGKYTLTLSESFVVAEPVTFEVKLGETTTVHLVVARR